MTTTPCSKCGKDLDSNAMFCPSCGNKQTSEAVISPHSGVTAWILCIFLGIFGAHRFYVGKIGTGLLMLFTFGGLGIWYFYDYFSIPCKNFTDSQGRYLECQRNKVFPAIMTCIFGFIMILDFAMIVLGIKAIAGSTQTALQNIVNNQITAIKENKLDDAYSYQSSKSMSANDFRDFIKQHPELNNNRSVKFPQTDYNNFDEDSGKIEAELTSMFGTKTIVHYEFIKEENKWKIIKTEISSE